ncbi:hypothetical protein LINPERHAP2_LOCUS409 [Linum perenne]
MWCPRNGDRTSNLVNPKSIPSGFGFACLVCHLNTLTIVLFGLLEINLGVQLGLMEPHSLALGATMRECVSKLTYLSHSSPSIAFIEEYVELSTKGYMRFASIVEDMGIIRELALSCA